MLVDSKKRTPSNTKPDDYVIIREFNPYFCVFSIPAVQTISRTLTFPKSAMPLDLSYELVLSHASKYSDEYAAELLGISESSFRKYRKNFDIPSFAQSIGNNQGKTINLSPETIREYASKYSDIEAAKKLCIATSTFWIQRQKFHVPSFLEATGRKINRKTGEVLEPGKGVTHQPNLVHDYFDSIDSEVKAYYLGLFAADGHIALSPECFFSCELQQPDCFVLQFLLDELNSGKTVKLYERKDKKPSGRIVVYSRHLVYSLLEKGITQNTEDHYAYPDLDKNLKRHFIRGLIDGDGHLKSISKTFNLGSCSYRLVSQVSSWVHESLGIDCLIKTRVLRSGKSFYTLTFGNKPKDVLAWLYLDSLIHIPRKKEQADIWLSRS